MVEEIVKRLKKQTTVQLLAKVAKLTGEELDACLIVLEQRGQDTSKLVTVKTPRVAPKKDSRVVVEIPADDDDLTPADKKAIEKAEKEADKAAKKADKKAPAAAASTKPKAEPKAKKDTVDVPKPDATVYPEGFAKGMIVKFKASSRSKNPGEEFAGVLKRYFFDKQDNGYYFLINVAGKEYCKKPNAVTAVTEPK